MFIGISLVIQWLRLCTSNAGDVGSIPGQETKVPHATKKIRCSQKKKKVIIMLIISEFLWLRNSGMAKVGLSIGSVQGVIWGCRYLKAHLRARFGLQGPFPSSLTWLLAEFISSQAMDQKPTLSSLPLEGPHHGSVLQQSILAQKREVTIF